MVDLDTLNGIVEERGLKFTAMAKSTGRSYGTLTSLFRGEREWKASDIQAVCKFLDIKSPKMMKDLFFKDE